MPALLDAVDEVGPPRPARRPPTTARRPRRGPGARIRLASSTPELTGAVVVDLRRAATAAACSLPGALLVAEQPEGDHGDVDVAAGEGRVDDGGVRRRCPRASKSTRRPRDPAARSARGGAASRRARRPGGQHDPRPAPVAGEPPRHRQRRCRTCRRAAAATAGVPRASITVVPSSPSLRARSEVNSRSGSTPRADGAPLVEPRVHPRAARRAAQPGVLGQVDPAAGGQHELVERVAAAGARPVVDRQVDGERPARRREGQRGGLPGPKRLSTARTRRRPRR